MSTWSKEELRKIADTDDFHISSFREDGETYGTPTWIWSVVVDDGLYVRPYNGHNSSWYKSAMQQEEVNALRLGLKTEAGLRDIDLHPDAAQILRNFIGNRTSGFLFQTANGTMLDPGNIDRDSLSPVLKTMGRDEAERASTCSGDSERLCCNGVRHGKS